MRTKGGYMDSVRLSVILPIYRVEQYLRKCLDSIEAQTYKNLEIILVDDGSPDNCGRICDEYAAKDSRIRVIHKENKGLSAAYNTGLDNATAGYVVIIDSDDWIEPEYCSVLFGNLEKYGADVSACGFFPFRGGEKKPAVREEVRVYTGLESIDRVKISPNGKIFKKSLFDGLRFPEDRHPGDIFLTYKVLYRATRVVVTSALLYNYLRRADGVTGLVPRAENLHVLDAYREKIRFFTERGHAAHAARTKKLLAATIAGLLDFFGKDRKKHAHEVSLLKKQMAEAAADCVSDGNLTLMQKAEVMLYRVFPGPALALARLKRELRAKAGPL